jgi:hypothetical protein
MLHFAKVHMLAFGCGGHIGNNPACPARIRLYINLGDVQ